MTPAPPVAKRSGTLLPLIAVVLVLFAVAALWPLLAAATAQAQLSVQIAAGLATFVVFFAAIGLAGRTEGIRFATAVGFSTRHAGWQLLTALALLAVTLAVTLALAALGFHMFGEGQTGLLPFLYGAVRSFLLVGFGEELIWRGYVLGAVRRNLRSGAAAVLLSSALFGLWHYPGGQDVLQVLVTMLFGVLWSAARMKIRHCSTFATGTAHGLHDLALLVIATLTA
ncbi:CPBP family intramembrane glutamic endopeptidase [Arthrobacter sp. FW306-06-A]|uniref:CPBP family intramembrane glutamic endopeptidase n=1 Tax=Arthrobacter sp. FW306-06-A TaxID=2879621 RepID=UPI001F1BE52C|nr:CPBP family intramembrane glutamic endopeptidase [Arthrobacter sp. FW306-06-A]UKA69993.1 CPBP family intramembrane metalloprotease [Arthrobacter sp. FW306-06-A]